MPLAPVIMVQGTASSVGKSLVTTALCRFFRDEGLRVLPFKAQNMALNAAVTRDGGEIGRSQAAQAEAAGVEAEVDMNPILLKPEADAHAQVVVLGKPIGRMSALSYDRGKPDLRGVVAGALDRLRARADLVVAEGAGSPAEVNLKDRDLVNMWVAKQAQARVLLVGDIDRGGVFAAFVGTLELLDPDERALVEGFVINKFRGDLRLLQDGLTFLEGRTGVPVLGVLPWVRDLGLADEDSQALAERRWRAARPDELDVAVVRLPHLSNHDELQPLERERGVVVRFVDRAEDLGAPDLVVLPGSKSTVADLDWLRRAGFAAPLAARAAAGHPVLGICGGAQMLGREILDPEGAESDRPFVEGLGLLPVRTRFGRAKTTARVRARVTAATFLSEGFDVRTDLAGYEIHMGQLEPIGEVKRPFSLVREGTSTALEDGAVAGAGGSIVGTLVHGLLENASLRAALLANLRRRRGLAGPPPTEAPGDVYDRLAAIVRTNMDVARLRAMARLR